MGIAMRMVAGGDAARIGRISSWGIPSRSSGICRGGHTAGKRGGAVALRVVRVGPNEAVLRGVGVIRVAGWMRRERIMAHTSVIRMAGCHVMRRQLHTRVRIVTGSYVR